MKTIVEILVEEKTADNSFHAANMLNVLLRPASRYLPRRFDGNPMTPPLDAREPDRQTEKL